MESLSVVADAICVLAGVCLGVSLVMLALLVSWHFDSSKDLYDDERSTP